MKKFYLHQYWLKYLKFLYGNIEYLVNVNELRVVFQPAFAIFG